MGCAKGDDANGTTAEGEAVSSVGRCDPAAGCRPTNFIAAVAASPPLPDPASWGPSGNTSGRAFARSLTKQTARKTRPVGCGKIGRSLRYTPWHRRPSYDLCRAPCDHPDFTSNAL